MGWDRVGLRVVLGEVDAVSAPIRSAEEIAREMVVSVDIEEQYGWFASLNDDGGYRVLMCMTGVVVSDIEIDRRAAEEDAVSWLSRLIEQSRTDGAAAARASGIVDGLRKARSIVFSTVSGEIEDELNRGIDEAIDEVSRRFESAPEQPRDLPGRVERLRAERAARRAQIAREDTGEARGFRYAIVCCVGWVGPWHLPGPHVHNDSCTHANPVVYEGDRHSAQARAQMHAERNDRGGATYHSPEIVPEEYIARVTAQRRWR